MAVSVSEVSTWGAYACFMVWLPKEHPKALRHEGAVWSAVLEGKMAPTICVYHQRWCSHSMVGLNESLMWEGFFIVVVHNYPHPPQRKMRSNFFALEIWPGLLCGKLKNSPVCSARVNASVCLSPHCVAAMRRRGGRSRESDMVSQPPITCPYGQIRSHIY